MKWGSPPRVRGKRLEEQAGERARRITPARAGNTGSAATGLPCARDHPRACGENRNKISLTHNKFGSPPRVRGKHIAISMRQTEDRITPARAGKTLIFILFKSDTSDHPRACGENSCSCASVFGR